MLPPTKNAALRRSSALALLEAGAQVECALEAQKILKSASARQKIPDNSAPKGGEGPPQTRYCGEESHNKSAKVIFSESRRW